jgi:hypothetical protein
MHLARGRDASCDKAPKYPSRSRYCPPATVVNGDAKRKLGDPRCRKGSEWCTDHIFPCARMSLEEALFFFVRAHIPLPTADGRVCGARRESYAVGFISGKAKLTRHLGWRRLAYPIARRSNKRVKARPSFNSWRALRADTMGRTPQARDASGDNGPEVRDIQAPSTLLNVIMDRALHRAFEAAERLSRRRCDPDFYLDFFYRERKLLNLFMSLHPRNRVIRGPSVYRVLVVKIPHRTLRPHFAS